MAWWEKKYNALSGQQIAVEEDTTVSDEWWSAPYKQIQQVGLDQPQIAQPEPKLISPPQEEPQEELGFFQKVAQTFRSAKERFDVGFKEGGLGAGIADIFIPEDELQPKEVRESNLKTLMERPLQEASGYERMLRSVGTGAVATVTPVMEYMSFAYEADRQTFNKIASAEGQPEWLKKQFLAYGKKQGAASGWYKQIAGDIREVEEKLRVDDPTIVDSFVEAVGSTLAFFTMGIVTGGEALLPTMVETMGEMGQVAKNTEGRPMDERVSRVMLDGAVNGVYNYFTNKIGLFSKEKVGLKKLLTGFIAEFSQEGEQQWMSNVTSTDAWGNYWKKLVENKTHDKYLFEDTKPILDEMFAGVLESAFMGGVIGSMFSLADLSTAEITDVTAVEEPKPLPERIYRGQEVDSLAGQSGVVFFTDSQSKAQEYAKVAKPLAGESEVIVRGVPETLKLHETNKASYLTVIDDPQIRENFDGIIFTEEDGSANFAIFNEKLDKLLKESGEITLEPKVAKEVEKPAEVEAGVEAEELEPTVLKHTKEIREAYKANEEKVYEAMGEIFVEMEIAEAGQRIFLEHDATSPDPRIIGIKSTFPDWIPEDLRSRKLFDKVLGNLVDIEALEYPSGRRTAQRALYDVALERIDSISGVDTSKARSAIIEMYDQAIEEKRAAKEAVEAPEVTRERPARGEKAARKESETLAFDATQARQFEGDVLENPEINKLVKQSEISKQLADILGVPIRHGKFSKSGAAAIYKGKARIIRTKVGYSVGEITHEAGHHLQKTIPELSKKAVARNTNELRAVGELTGYGADKPTVEGFAEFIRLWTVDRTLIKKTAPSFSKYFSDIMTKYPEVGEILDATRRDFMRWKSQPAAAKVLSQISMDEDRPALKERVTTTMDKIKSRAFDDLYPIKQFVDIAKKEGVKVSPTQDAYIMARLMKGIGGKADTFLNYGTFGRTYSKKLGGKWKVDFKGKSLKSILSPIEGRGALDDFRAYLVAIRTMELSKRDIQTGISVEDALTAVGELNKKHPSFKTSAKELYTYQNQLVDYLVESHLISKDGAIAMRKANEFYVPFYRVMEGMESKGRAKKLAEATANVKRIKGSSREIVDPLESVVKNTHALINSADANMLGRAMAQLADKNFKNARMFERIDPKMAKVADFVLSDYIDEKYASEIHKIMGGDEDIAVNLFRPSMFPPSGNVVTILEQGKKQYYEVDPELFSAIRSLEREQINGIIKILRIPAGWLRAGAVLSPEFIPRNPVRDQWTAFVYSETGYIPLLDMGRGMFEFLSKGNVYKLWKIAGGEQSAMVSVDRVSTKKNLKEILASRKQKTLKYIKNPIEILRSASELMEISTRLGEMRKALDKTGSAELSAFYSREVTQDFNKIGSKVRALNMIAAFSGAQVGGITKFHQAMKDNPGRTTMKALIGITLPSILLYAANRDDERWKEIPQWQKDLFWIVFVGDKIIRMPKPFLVGQLFGSFPERVLEFMDTKDPEYMSEFFTNFVQNNGISVIPTALQPVLEDITNYNFFLERPLISQGLQGLPPKAQYHYYTTEIAKILGGLVNKSPIKIDNYISGYTAGLGRTLVKALDRILVGTGLVDQVTLPEPTLADVPVVKAFVVRKPIGGAGMSVNKMYNRMDDLNKKEKHIKSLLDKGEAGKAKELAEKYGLTMYYDTSRDAWYNPNARVYRRVSRYLSEIRNIQDKVKTSKKLNAKEKREKLEKLDLLLTRVTKMTMEAEQNMSKEDFEEFKINFDYSGL